MQVRFDLPFKMWILRLNHGNVKFIYIQEIEVLQEKLIHNTMMNNIIINSKNTEK